GVASRDQLLTPAAAAGHEQRGDQAEGGGQQDFQDETPHRSLRLLADLESVGERARKLRGANRRGGCRDVVGRASPSCLPCVEVELEPCRARIAVARLPDRTRVE